MTSKQNVCSLLADLYKLHSSQATCDYNKGEMTYFKASFKSQKNYFMIECALHVLNPRANEDLNKIKNAYITIVLCNEQQYKLFTLPYDHPNSLTHYCPKNCLINEKYQVQLGGSCNNSLLINHDATIQLPVPETVNIKAKL